MEENKRRQLLFILHRGLGDARNLSLGPNSQQIFHLADALENIPLHLIRPCASSLDEIERDLATYAQKYPDSFPYRTVLNWQIPDDI